MTQYLNGVYADATAWEPAAKIRKLSHLRQEGTLGTVILTREWIAIDATLADNFVAALVAAGLTVTNPQADQQTYTGVFRVADIRIEGDDTRAVTVVQVLALPDASGVTATWMMNCDTSVSRTTYFNQSKAQYDAIVATYSTSVAGRTVDISPYRTNEIGMVDVVVTISTVQARNYPSPATGLFTTGEFVSRDSFSVQREWQQIGLTDDANMRPVTDEDGVIKTRKVVIQDDCSKRVTTDERQATAVTPVVQEKRITAFATETETTGKNAVARETEEVSQTQNQIVTTSSELNETPGRFDNTRKVLVGTPDADVGNERVVTRFADSATVTARNETARETAVTSLTPGTITETSSVKNDLGSFDNTRKDIVAVADADVENRREVQAFLDTATLTARNEEVREVPVTVQVQNAITETRSVENDAGRFDNSTETKTAIVDTNVDNAKLVTAFDLRATITARNETARETEVTVLVPGTLTTTTSKKNDFASFDNTREDRTFTAVTAAVDAATAGAYSIETRVTDRNQVAAATPPAAVVTGQIKTVSVEKTEAGRFDNTTTVDLATANVGQSNQREVTLFEDRATVVTANQAAAVTPVTTLTPGVITRTFSVRNRYNLFDNTSETRTAISAPSQTVITGMTTGETRTVTVSENAATALGVAVLVTGTATTNTSEANELGRFRTRVETIAANDLSVTAFAAIKTQRLTGTKTVYRNATSQPALSEPYGELSIRKNDVGLWDGEKTVVTYYSDPSTPTSIYFTATNQTEIRIEKQSSPNAFGYHWRKITLTYNCGITTTPSSAQTLVNGGKRGSFVKPYRDSATYWKKVTSIVADATWTETNLSVT